MKSGIDKKFVKHKPVVDFVLTSKTRFSVVLAQRTPEHPETQQYCALYLYLPLVTWNIKYKNLLRESYELKLVFRYPENLTKTHIK